MAFNSFLTYNIMALFVYPKYIRVYLGSDWLIYFPVLIDCIKVNNNRALNIIKGEII